jgi:hypothetical protein
MNDIVPTDAALIMRDMPPPGTGFKVAFSFAGEQRDLVRSIAEACEARLGRNTVFFDEWFPHVLPGMTADMFLQDIYGKQTQMMVLCVAKRYAEKPWTRAEHAAIMARVNDLMASDEPRDRYRYLPIRVGEGEVPGVLSNTITLDARESSRTPALMAEIIARRLAEINALPSTPPQAKGTVLLLPCVEARAPMCASLQSWLESMSITVLRPNALLPAGEFARVAADALQKANVVVEWFQPSQLEADRPYIEAHEKIRALHAALPAAQRPTPLMWLPSDTSSPGQGEPVTESSGRRMLFEQLKQTVLDAATAPRDSGSTTLVTASGSTTMGAGGGTTATTTASVTTVSTPGGSSGSSRIVIGAPRIDGSSVQQLITALPSGTPRDSQYDDLHQPPAVIKSAPDVDERIQRAIRRTARSLVLIDGACSRNWIEERLRAYDLFSESAARVPKLIVWDVPQTAPKPPLEFWPEGAVLVASAHAADVAAVI